MGEADPNQPSGSFRVLPGPTHSGIVGPRLDPPGFGSEPVGFEAVGEQHPHRVFVTLPAAAPLAPSPPAMSTSDATLLAGLRAESRAQPPSEASRIGRRVLLVVLCAVLIVPGAMIGLAMLDIELPPLVALGLLAMIGIGALLPTASAESGRERSSPEPDDGVPFGCCPGPRPLRSARAGR